MSSKGLAVGPPAREAAEPTQGPRTAAEVVMRDEGPQFPNTETRAYKRAVRAKLEAQKEVRYAHLCLKWWKYLVGLMLIVGFCRCQPTANMFLLFSIAIDADRRTPFKFHRRP